MMNSCLTFNVKNPRISRPISLLLIGLSFLVFARCTQTPTAELRVNQKGSFRTWSIEELQNHPSFENILIEHDPSYSDQPARYQAVPVHALVDIQPKSLAEGTQLQYESTDGFLGSVPIQKALNTDPKLPIAYIALETKKWPILPGKRASAGPFYLVWKTPSGQQIHKEEWPYQLATLSLGSPPHELYPRVYPRNYHPDRRDNASQGARIYAVNCLPCHSMNKQGSGHIGPDLNYPMSPLEYFASEKLMRQFIRNPQTLRFYPTDRMSHFGPDEISEEEMDNLFSYFETMKKERASVFSK